MEPHRQTRWRQDLVDALRRIEVGDLAGARTRLESLATEAAQHEDPLLLGSVDLLRGFAFLCEGATPDAAAAWERARALFASEQLDAMVAAVDAELARHNLSASPLLRRHSGAGEPDSALASPGLAVSHSPDFRSVVWYGREFQFTATQAACVEILWRAWENGAPDIGQERILEDVGSRALRLLDVFRRSEAWGTMISRGATRGTYRLQSPVQPGVA